MPLRRKGRVIGALNLLSDTPGQFTETDEALLRQFGAHVAVAIENARLFEHAKEYTSTLETLAEVAREFGAILNTDELLTRIANLARRVIDYRTFGILLVNEDTNELEMKVAGRYGDSKVNVPRVKLGTVMGRLRRPAQGRRQRPDVAADPRYIKVVDDARSELVIPLRCRNRCTAVRPRSPELDAFGKNMVEIVPRSSRASRRRDRKRAALRPFAKRGAAREGESVRAARPDRAVAAELPKRLKQADVAARFGRHANLAATSTLPRAQPNVWS